LNLTGRTSCNEKSEESNMIFFYFVHCCIPLCGKLLDMESRLTEQIFSSIYGVLELKYFLKT